jgi:hypothetical protein
MLLRGYPVSNSDVDSIGHDVVDLLASRGVETIKRKQLLDANAGLVSLRYGSQSHDLGSDSIYNFIRPIDGRILISSEESGDADEVEAGRFRAQYVDVDAVLNAGRSLFDLTDEHSQEMTEYHEVLFEPGPCELRRSVKKALGDDILQPNILIIQPVEILPEFRRSGLGLAEFWHLITFRSAGCGLVAMQVFPLQFRETDGDGLDEWKQRMRLTRSAFPCKTSEDGIKKLVSYYKRLGVRSLGRKGYLLLDTVTKHPIPEEVKPWIA